jgi:mono/diheme cytochrome c family protein
VAAAVVLSALPFLHAARPAAAKPTQASDAAAALRVEEQRALVGRYCITCHNRTLNTGGLALDAFDVADVGGHPEIWEKVVRKLGGGLMPPAGRPRPDRAVTLAFVSWLESELDRAAERRPDPGRTEPFHRLNRAEYRNAIRDLLSLDIDVTAHLPGDDASHGFDNIAGVLKVSPTLMERYLTAARRISRLAVGLPVPFPGVDTIRVPEDLPQDDRIEGLPFGTRGGVRVSHIFPVDADYVIKVRLSRLGLSGGATEDVPRFAESHDLEVSLDGVRLKVFTLAGETLEPGRRQDAYQQGRANLDADWEVRVPVGAGPHEIVVAFLKKSSALNETVRLPFMRPYAGAGGDTRYQPYLSSVTISGPFAKGGRAEDTPSRRRIFVCRPTSPGDELSCARSILASLARRAYRRPVTDVDLKPLVAFYAEGRGEGGFDAGIALALERLLVSPHFLFRVERDPPTAGPGQIYPVADLELASRLSFFLWSSIPDEELVGLAAAGRLQDPSVLERQVRRMRGDRRANALVENFAGQWLYLRNISTLSPDLDRFPDFDDSLRQAFKRETELFVGSIVREDRSVLDLFTADYTFVNERLARHYGIPNVRGSHFRRVKVTDPARQGLLGHGSILAVTAYPHRTSPVLRGKWVLENLLGTPPPPPPPNVPDLRDTNTAGELLSMRERMAQHRASPVCATCHSMMDPPGFSLETFDAVGRLRSVDERFEKIDAGGALPDGRRFEGPAGLRQALLANPERVMRTFTEKLLTYALGRGLEPNDMPAVRRVTRSAAEDGYRFSAIVLGIVRSTPFRMRRTDVHGGIG